jgi:tryptophan synthase alpha chain
LHSLNDRSKYLDAVLVTDAVDDEAADIREELRRSGMDMISLVAPTTSDERLERICDEASGFIYAVSRTGVTGSRDSMSQTAESVVRRVRQFTDMPVAVGFGVSERRQVEDVWRYADAAVVGSAIVDRIEHARSPKDAVESVYRFARELCGNLQN